MWKWWLWVFWHLLLHHSANECGILANAHYCLLSPCLIFMNEKSMSWILYKDWVDHYVKGHLTNSLLLPIMANLLQKCSNNPPQLLLELAGFAMEAARRQTAVNGSSVTLQPAHVINERTRWNMTKWARRLRGRRKGHRRGFLYCARSLSWTGQRTSFPQDGNRRRDEGLWACGCVSHLLTTEIGSKTNATSARLAELF